MWYLQISLNSATRLDDGGNAFFAVMKYDGVALFLSTFHLNYNHNDHHKQKPPEHFAVFPAHFIHLDITRED